MTSTATTTGSPTPALEPPRTRDLVLGLSGLVFAALLLLVVLVPHAGLDLDPNRPPADPGAVVSFFSTHAALEQYQALMHSLAAVALLVFVAALAERVRRVERSSRPAEGSRLVSGLTLAAGAALAAVLVASMTLVSGTIELTGAVDGGTQLWLYDLGWSAHVRALYLLPVALVPACRVLRRARALPAPLAWSGQVVGAVGLLAMAGILTPATSGLSYPALFLLILWVLGTAVLALTRGLRRCR